MTTGYREVGGLAVARYAQLAVADDVPDPARDGLYDMLRCHADAEGAENPTRLVVEQLHHVELQA